MISEKDLELYLKKSKDNRVFFDDGITIYKGRDFVTFKKVDNNFVVIHLYSIHNFQWWYEFLKKIAIGLNCKYFMFATKRNPKAFAKLTNSKIDCYVLKGVI